MKSIKNIYEKIYDFENLYKAWEEARKGKRYRDDVLIFNRNFEEHLINIQNELIYGTYAVGKYHTFYVYEPKKRLIGQTAVLVTADRQEAGTLLLSENGYIKIFLQGGSRYFIKNLGQKNKGYTVA